MNLNTALPSTPAPPTGSATADAEHGIQLGLLDAAITALADGERSAEELLDQLVTYSEAHFLSEQLLMRMAARANYEGHVEQHAELMQELALVKEQFERGECEGAEAMLRDHQERLLEHIRSWDRSVAEPPGAGVSPGHNPE